MSIMSKVPFPAPTRVGDGETFFPVPVKCPGDGEAFFPVPVKCPGDGEAGDRGPHGRGNEEVMKVKYLKINISKVINLWQNWLR